MYYNSEMIYKHAAFFFVLQSDSLSLQPTVMELQKHHGEKKRDLLIKPDFYVNFCSFGLRDFFSLLQLLIFWGNIKICV